MKLLAFDCSGKKVRVFAQNEEKECCIEREGVSGTESLLVVIDEALKSVGLEVRNVKVFVVGVGPGSWTGSRVCVSTALGLLSAMNAPQIYTFSSFDIVKSVATRKGVDWDLVVVPAYANFVFSSSVDGTMRCVAKKEVLQEILNGKISVGEEGIFEQQEVVAVDFGACVKDVVNKNKSVEVGAIEPIYLKLSQAEEQLQKKRGEK